MLSTGKEGGPRGHWLADEWRCIPPWDGEEVGKGFSTGVCSWDLFWYELNMALAVIHV